MTHETALTGSPAQAVSCSARASAEMQGMTRPFVDAVLTSTEEISS